MLDHAGEPTAFTTISYIHPTAEWFEEDDGDPTYEESPLLVRPDSVTAVRACRPSLEQAIHRAWEYQQSSGDGVA